MLIARFTIAPLQTVKGWCHFGQIWIILSQRLHIQSSIQKRLNQNFYLIDDDGVWHDKVVIMFLTRREASAVRMP